jgi:hypothetical protein
VDWVDLGLCGLASAFAIPSQRFLGVYALIAAPYLSRDLEAWIAARRWPRWSASVFARTGLAAVACGLIGVPEWRRPLLEPGIGVAFDRFPIAACDFMERHGVRGHGFEHFRFVGYQAWRFWPDRSRLPFMDIHQSGTPSDRDAFAAAFTDPASWPNLARRYRLDYALLDRRQRSGAELLDEIDSDSTWALVFLDDVSALYVDRATQKAVADSFALPWLGGGGARLGASMRNAVMDSTAAGHLRAELERAASDSRWNATAQSMLANLDMSKNRAADARHHLEAALAVDPEFGSANYRLGMIDLFERQAREALRHFERERAISGEVNGLDAAMGMAYQALGDRGHAIDRYRAELARNPGNRTAQAGLDSLGAGVR